MARAAAGGWAIISVPALPWLWSYRDQAAGHLRRYTARALRSRLAVAGFEPVGLHFYPFFLFPVVAASRMLGRANSRVRDLEDRPGGVLNAALSVLTLLEVRLGGYIKWPVGSSLIAVARKP